LALGDTVYETDTPYHHLLVADSYDPTHQSYVRYLILDDNLHSAMDLGNPDRTVFEYTDYFHLGFLLNANITRVLFIGGGGFTGPKAFLKDYSKVSVDVAEIDPEVIRVAKTYFDVNASNPRLHIYNEDGRIFLHRTDQKYDLVILDAYSKSYVPFHLMTEEFFQVLENHLTSTGSVISNLIASTAGSGAQLLLAEVRTMHTVYPNVYLFPVRGSDYPEPQNIEILTTVTSSTLTKDDFATLAAESSVVKIPALSHYVGNYLTVETGNAPVLTDNFAPVETLLNPISGQPLQTGQESTTDWPEIINIVAAVLVLTAVFLLLIRKRIL
jgi:spermidine synthase